MANCKHTLALCALAFTACGNWSNRDLEFAGALPDRTELQSKLPGLSSTSQGLTQRKDGLNVGEPSKAYRDVKQASGDFNSLLDSLLTGLDNLRKVAPTTRSETSRTWGPFADSQNAGAQLKLTVEQLDPQTFSYALASRPTGGEFFDVISGSYQPTVDLKKGTGVIALNVKETREKLQVPASLKQVDRITMEYSTESFPKRVHVAIAFSPGASTGFSGVGYVYREQEDHSGEMAFQYASTSAETTVVEVTSRWNADGAGRAEGVVKEGTYAGLTATECWNTSFKVVYSRERWPGGADNGAEADCPTITGF